MVGGRPFLVAVERGRRVLTSKLGAATPISSFACGTPYGYNVCCLYKLGNGNTNKFLENRAPLRCALWNIALATAGSVAKEGVERGVEAVRLLYRH